jgi:hypothetical protein
LTLEIFIAENYSGWTCFFLHDNPLPEIASLRQDIGESGLGFCSSHGIQDLRCRLLLHDRADISRL